MELKRPRRCRLFAFLVILSSAFVFFIDVSGILSATGDRGLRTRQTSQNSCDGECHRFQRLLAQWPNEKPKAAIVYLLYAPNLKRALYGIRTVDTFFCRKFDYPIIVFHEADLNATHREQVRKAAAWNKERVFFQQVEFKLPTFLKKPVPLKIPCYKPIGYRHMCRFHAKGN